MRRDALGSSRWRGERHGGLMFSSWRECFSCQACLIRFCPIVCVCSYLKKMMNPESHTLMTVWLLANLLSTVSLEISFRPITLSLI